MRSARLISREEEKMKIIEVINATFSPLHSVVVYATTGKIVDKSAN